MRLKQVIQKIFHFPRRLVRESIMVFNLVRLSFINRFGRSPVTQSGMPVVSLTTYGNRIKSVHLAIESIANGFCRPSRLILWLDEQSVLANLPPAIRRLQKRGLEVRLTKNYGPHKKYYPYVESQSSFEVPLVTADDDILYPRYWLKALVSANQEHPKLVNCFRARVIELADGRFKPYSSLESCLSTVSQYRNIAIGCMGVIYPEALLLKLKRAGTAFESCCPKADDIWLHVQAIRSGHKIRQIMPKLPYLAFQNLPGTQQSALSRDNVDSDGNDPQIKATYSQSDIQILQEESVLQFPSLLAS
ncbi:MAG TPA: hypothetical protein VG844_18895 [Terracidiphilus sp.]|nr:hypothetical protein [Terracidiphilus sp.]